MFGNNKAQDSAKRLLEEELYEQVILELSEGTKRAGLWAKAIANSNGDENKAKSLYITYRVQSITDEMILKQEEIAQEKIKEELARKVTKETLGPIAYATIFILMGFVLIGIFSGLS